MDEFPTLVSEVESDAFQRILLPKAFVDLELSSIESHGQSFPTSRLCLYVHPLQPDSNRLSFQRDSLQRGSCGNNVQSLRPSSCVCVCGVALVDRMDFFGSALLRGVSHSAA